MPGGNDDQHGQLARIQIGPGREPVLRRRRLQSVALATPGQGRHLRTGRGRRADGHSHHDSRRDQLGGLERLERGSSRSGDGDVREFDQKRSDHQD